MQLMFEHNQFKFFETDPALDENTLFNVGKKLENALVVPSIIKHYGDQGKIILVYNDSNEIVANTYIKNNTQKFDFIYGYRNLTITDKELITSFYAFNKHLNFNNVGFIQCFPKNIDFIHSLFIQKGV